MALALTLLPTGTSQQVTAGGVLALGSGVLGSVAAFLTRRSTAAAPQLAAVSADVEQRLAQLEARVHQTASSLQNQVRAVEEVAPAEAQPILNRIDTTLQPFATQQFSWQNIVHNAATDAINQLRLEEIYLGVSEPLVRYVLGSEARDGAAIKDPHAAARRFLDLIYESTPNIERLSGVLMDLYRSGTGGAPTTPAANSSSGP
jgi:hypothetical protein